MLYGVGVSVGMSIGVCVGVGVSGWCIYCGGANMYSASGRWICVSGMSYTWL